MAAAPTISLPSVRSFGVFVAGGAITSDRRSGCASANAIPAANARSLAATSSALFLMNRFRRPETMLSRARPHHPAIRPRTMVFFAFSVPACSLAIASIGTAMASAGCTRQRDLVGRDARLLVVDDRGGGVDRQLAAEAEEVLPVQGDRDVERPADVEGLLGRHAQPERGFPAADLGPEALGHDAVVALERQCRDERVAGRDDAVAAGACHANRQVVSFGAHNAVCPASEWARVCPPPRLAPRADVPCAGREAEYEPAVTPEGAIMVPAVGGRKSTRFQPWMRLSRRR